MTGQDHPLAPAGGVPPGTARGSERVGSIVQRIVEPVLASLGLVLVDVEVRGRGPKTLIRVFIERSADQGEGAVTLDDCERVHKLVGHALDAEDPIPHAYLLEVSSPGLDRPIRRRSEEHTSELQSLRHLVCRLLLEKKNMYIYLWYVN